MSLIKSIMMIKSTEKSSNIEIEKESVKSSSLVNSCKLSSSSFTPGNKLTTFVT